MTKETKQHYYATDDTEIYEAMEKYWADRKEWGKRLDALKKKVGREVAVSYGFGESHAVAFGLKKGEPHSPGAWKDTDWVLTRDGFLRPRASTRKGKELLKAMTACGTMPHPAEKLKGIPKMTGFLGRPGIMTSRERKLVVVTYNEKVKHDGRWREIKVSEYWTILEEQEAASEKRRVKG